MSALTGIQRPTLVSDFLHAGATCHPDREAVVCGSRRLTYAMLEAQTGCLRETFLDLGVKRGDRVAIEAGSTETTVIAVLATLTAGAIFVVVDPRKQSKARRAIRDDSGPSILVTCDPDAGGSTGTMVRVRRVVGGPASADHGAHIDLSTCAIPIRQRPSTSVRENDLCGLFYTSGSTGEPKGVAVTHLNVVSAARSILEYLDIRSSDTVLNLLPLSSDYGLYNVLMSLWRGARVVLGGPFLHPGELLRPLATEGITGLPLTPTIVAILSRFRRLDFQGAEGIRWVTTTGQALPPRHSRWLRTVFPRARVFSMYGLTECKRVSYLAPEELEFRPTSVGKPIPNTSAWLVDEQGETIEIPGRVGELVVQGPHVMQGYWNRPEATSRVIQNGDSPEERRLSTGDLFTTDAEGYLYFVGRRDTLIKSGGHVVSPRHVEEVVCELAGVAEAAVVPVPHEILGQALRLVAVPEDSVELSSDDVREHCRRRLDRVAVPREILIRETLPRTLAGKTDYNQLALLSDATTGTGE
jgi:long-chain acyl-CoA synthetase